MVGTSVSYALGKITRRDIYELLTIPSKEHFQNARLSAAPPYGLYLANIEFSETAMRIHKDVLDNRLDSELKDSMVDS